MGARELRSRRGGEREHVVGDGQKKEDDEERHKGGVKERLEGAKGSTGVGAGTATNKRIKEPPDHHESRVDRKS